MTYSTEEILEDMAETTCWRTGLGGVGEMVANTRRGLPNEGKCGFVFTQNNWIMPKRRPDGLKEAVTEVVQGQDVWTLADLTAATKAIDGANVRSTGHIMKELGYTLYARAVYHKDVPWKSRRAASRLHEVKRLMLAGRTVDEVALELALSPVTVRGYRAEDEARTGVRWPRGAVHARVESEVVNLAAAGKSVAEIAAELGCDVTKVYRARKRTGVAYVNGKFTPAQREDIGRRAQDTSVPKLAKELGVSDTIVRRYAAAYRAKVSA